MKPIALFDAYLDERGGSHNFLPLLGSRALPVRLTQEDIVFEPNDISALIITGSAGSVLSPTPWIDRLNSWMSNAVRESLPILGVCFGHQVLAQAIWGDKSIRKCEVPGLGWEDIETLGLDPLTRSVPKRFRTFVSHSDEVIPGFSGMKVLARSQRCSVHGFRRVGFPHWGLQFHAEMGLEEASDLVRERSSQGKVPHTFDEIMKEAVPSDGLIRTVLANFLGETFPV